MGLLNKGNAVTQVDDDLIDTAQLESEPEATTDKAQVIDNAPAKASGNVPAVASTGVGGLVSASGNMTQDLADDGFEGLDLGFGAFPVITLQNTGDFVSSEGAEFGTEFDCVVLSSKNKYICKTRGTTEDEEDFFYSYDKEYATTGETVAEKVAEWEAKGWGYEWKPYLDVAAQLHGGDHADDLVMFSIPKTSIPRFSGYVASIKLKHGLPPSKVITRVYRGDKITKVKYPFFPWAFKMVGPLV